MGIIEKLKTQRKEEKFTKYEKEFQKLLEKVVRKSSEIIRFRDIAA